MVVTNTCKESDSLQEIVARLDELQQSMAEVREFLAGTAKEYLTVDEFGQCAGRAAYTVRTWIKNGLIVAERIAGTGPKGRLLIPRNELKKLVASGRGESLATTRGKAN